jgi:selenide,water dikinase
MKTSTQLKHRPTRNTDGAAVSPLKLTEFSSCAGCAAKLSQTVLKDVLARLPADASKNGDPNVLVGSDTFDDAGVYRLNRDTALVQTVDFFTPIVDDPFDFGQIAATNALSDVYAMGGRPITALNLLGVPAHRLGPDAIAAILRNLIGGHTIRVPEPIYGLSVTGLVHPDRLLTNAKARVGDLLVLTKPLGTGIATTAIKRGLASMALAARVTKVMTHLNTVGAALAEQRLIECATDITGFGLIGHLGNIVRASSVGAELSAKHIPVISREIKTLVGQDCIPGGTQSNLAAAEQLVKWNGKPSAMRTICCDAQTSGGLLLCIPPKQFDAVMGILKQHRTLAANLIGRIIGSSKPCIIVNL